MTADPVIEFIQRRFRSDCNWKTGNCYFFAVILESRFPGGQICYEPVLGHFVYLYNGKYYDWGGEATILKKPIPWNEYEQFDHAQKKRIVRYCIK